MASISAPFTTLLLLVLATRAVPLVAGQDIPDAYKCYNTDFQFLPTDWKQALVDEAPARLFLAGVWESKISSTLPLTIVTHTSHSRWKQLRGQCRSWKGPLVASVYIHIEQAGGEWLSNENDQIVKDSMMQLQKMHQSMEEGHGCQLTVLLFWEVYATNFILYPYNTLRNYAILQAKTPMVAMVDVDFLLAYSLSEELQQQNRVEELTAATRNGTVFVLPAFETHLSVPNLHDEIQLAYKAIHAPKKELREMWHKQEIRGAQLSKFPKGHRGTNFPRWVDGDDEFKADYEWQFEPYFIVDRLRNRLYDIRFRGYFYDKSLQAAHLFSDGYQFQVHPRLFIVHCPHPLAQVHQDKARWEELFQTLRPKAFGSLLQMVQHGYRPRVDNVTVGCMRSMDWWSVAGAVAEATGEREPFRPFVWFPKKVTSDVEGGAGA